jgi:enterochelin esterase family protein
VGRVWGNPKIDMVKPARMKDGIERLHTSLEGAHVKHAFYESPGASHEWQTWRRDLKEFAPMLFR